MYLFQNLKFEGVALERALERFRATLRADAGEQSQLQVAFEYDRGNRYTSCLRLGPDNPFDFLLMKCRPKILPTLVRGNSEAIVTRFGTAARSGTWVAAKSSSSCSVTALPIVPWIEIALEHVGAVDRQRASLTGCCGTQKPSRLVENYRCICW